MGQDLDVGPAHIHEIAVLEQLFLNPCGHGDLLWRDMVDRE